MARAPSARNRLSARMKSFVYYMDPLSSQGPYGLGHGACPCVCTSWSRRRGSGAGCQTACVCCSGLAWEVVGARARTFSTPSSHADATLTTCVCGNAFLLFVWCWCLKSDARAERAHRRGVVQPPGHARGALGKPRDATGRRNYCDKRRPKTSISCHTYLNNYYTLIIARKLRSVNETSGGFAEGPRFQNRPPMGLPGVQIAERIRQV